MIDPIVNIPNKQSGAEQWIQFYKDMKSSIGKKKAASLFVAFWNQRGSTKANTGKLANLLKEEGIEFDPTLKAQIGSGAIDIFDKVGDVFSAGKTITIALLVIIGGVLALALYNIVKDPTKSIGMTTKAKALL